MKTLEPALEISTDPKRLDRDLIYEFLTTSYWARGRSRNVVERSIDNSLCFGGYIRGKQIAFARVISDRCVFAYLADVFVIPPFRGRGIGKALMRAVMEHPDLRNLRLFLLRTRDAHGLYAGFGFRPLGNPEWVMEIHNAET
jgi:GNAT superfamily N-acetyltransferase